MPNPNFDQVLTTTLQKLMPKVEYSAFQRRAFAMELARKNRVTKQDGGAFIQKPVNFNLAQGGSSYSGYDTLSQTIWTGPTSARYEWKQYQQPIAIDGLTELRNNGSSAVVKLLPELINIAEESVMENLNTMWFSNGTGNGGKDMLGLGALIGDASDTITTVGGIPCTGANAETKWQSYVARNAGNFSTVVGSGNLATLNGFKVVQTAMTRCTYGNKKPQAFFTTESIYNSAYDAIAPGVRYQDVEMANQGFENITIKNTPLYFDTQIPAGPGGDLLFYGVDFSSIYLVGHSQRWFTTTEFKQPDHKDSRWAYILLAGELIATNRRTSFRLEFDGA